MRIGTISAVVCAATLMAMNGRADAQQSPERQDSTVVPAGGIHTVVIRTEAGKLRVTGDEATTAITTHATFRASSRAYLGQLTLRFARHGDTLEIHGQFPQVGHGKDFDVAAAIDMAITLPTGIAVDSHSSMGDVWVRNVESIAIENALGDVTVDHIHGDVSVLEQMGIVDIADVEGQVRMPKGAGQVSIRNVRASVDIAQHDIGPLHIIEVGRDVHVGSMRSGFISVAHIAGNLTVDHVHERDTYFVQYHDVKGAVDVPPRRRD